MIYQQSVFKLYKNNFSTNQNKDRIVPEKNPRSRGEMLQSNDLSAKFMDDLVKELIVGKTPGTACSHILS